MHFGKHIKRMLEKGVALLLLAALLCAAGTSAAETALEDSELLTRRLLTDAEIAALDGKTPQQLKEALSTVADVKAFLNRRYPSLWHDGGMSFCDNDPETVYRSAYCFLANDDAPAVGRCDIATMATYLLSDDLDICGLYAIGDGVITRAVNRIKTGDMYIFVDMVEGMDADAECRSPSAPQLPQARTASQEEYLELILSDATLKQQISDIALEDKGIGFMTYTNNEFRTFNQVNSIYTDVSKVLTDAEYYEKKYGHVKPENIGQYQLSQVLGGVTLTADEARALVDATPEQVKEAVKTAGDVLMYMLAANIQDSHGDKTMCIDGNWWHYNMSAKEVMQTRTGNCGSSANLANYLLEGDYDEVGYILQGYYPGNGGGHVYNYILQDGKYTIVDYSWYIFGGYYPENDFPVLMITGLDSLEDFVPYCERLYGGVSLLLAHTSGGRHYPNIFGEDSADLGNVYVIPEGVPYTLLYNDENGYVLAEMPLPDPPQAMDWRIYW